MAQQVKDLALSLFQQWLLLWCGFNPWPRVAWPKKKKKKNEVYKFPEKPLGVKACFQNSDGKLFPSLILYPSKLVVK